MESIQLNKWGPVLSGRSLGREIRSLIKKRLKNGSITVDFRNIDVASHSFCDEVFGILIKEDTSVTKRLKVINATDEIVNNIKYVMMERVKE